MNRRPRIRFSVLLFLTLALLGVCLIVLHHYRSRDIPGVDQATAGESLNSGESVMLPSEPESIQPVSVSPEAVISRQAEVALPQIEQPGDLYRALQESNDPQEKRNLRKQIAAWKPGQVPFHFALEKYAGATTDEEKLHLQSIVGQIDVSDFVSEVAKIASETSDESLFVSLAYALRNSTNSLAKQELLNLAASNKLPSLRTNSVMSNQGMVALHRCLLDSLQPSDSVWINEYLQAHSLNPAQERILADYVAKTERAINRP